ncbi:hypothetical protein BYT27DRAFT_7263953 [Phlegmacium glaucopus]|nr:hypothetical protein BYT27DRAFT_7263953 [Phlegmacium glaucopus]
MTPLVRDSIIPVSLLDVTIVVGTDVKDTQIRDQLPRIEDLNNHHSCQIWNNIDVSAAIVSQEPCDNHPLRADTSTKSHEEVIWTFINSTQELTPNEGSVAVMGLEMPADEKIQEGLDVVKGYAPAVTKPDNPKKKKKLDARYYGLLPEVDLEELLDPILANENKVFKFWTKLKTDNRVTKQPHVTIVHRRLRLRALILKSLLLEVLMKFKRAVPPVEAKAMVQAWRKNGNADNTIQSIKLDDLTSFTLSIFNYYRPMQILIAAQGHNLGIWRATLSYVDIFSTLDAPPLPSGMQTLPHITTQISVPIITPIPLTFIFSAKYDFPKFP